MSMKPRGTYAVVTKALNQADQEIAAGTPAGQTKGERAADAAANGAPQVTIGNKAVRVAPQTSGPAGSGKS